MKLEDYHIIFYRQDDGSWVAEVPDIPGCYAVDGNARSGARLN